MYSRGKIKLNNTEFKFILLDDNLEIIFDDMNDAKSVSDIYYNNGVFSFTGMESLNYSTFTGVGDDGRIYDFHITSSHLTFNKSFECKVCYYAIYYNLRDVNNPNKKRLKFSGNEIDGMANYNTLYQHIYNSNMSLTAIDLEPFRNKNAEKHSFEIDNINYSISFVDGYTTNSSAKFPIEFKNCISLEISNINKIDEYYKNHVKVKNLLSFIYHRRNIRFENIKIQSYDGQYYFDIGEFVVFDSKSIVEEVDKKRCVKYEQISTIFTTLTQQIFNNDLHLDHIPSSFTSNRTISAGSFVILLAAFQYEFDRFYKVEHKPKSIELRNEMYDEISKLKDNSNGKKRKKYEIIIDHLDDDQLEAKILQIFKIYPEAIKKLGERIYLRNGFKFEKNDIAKRLAKQRNDFAHGNIKNDFKQICIVDYLLLEKIVYFIQLVNLGLEINSAIEISDRVTIG